MYMDLVRKLLFNRLPVRSELKPVEMFEQRTHRSTFSEVPPVFISENIYE